MPQGIEYVDALLPPVQVAKMLSQADFLVSSRMHPIVLGSRSSTPFFAVGWEYKVERMAEALSGSSCFADATSLDDGTVGTVMEAFAGRKRLGRTVGKNAARMRRLAAMNRLLLARKLEEWGYDPIVSPIKNV
jgi:polysaccharide pyruvyl transferase WcaK-like protein